MHSAMTQAEELAATARHSRPRHRGRAGVAVTVALSVTAALFVTALIAVPASTALAGQTPRAAVKKTSKRKIAPKRSAARQRKNAKRRRNREMAPPRGAPRSLPFAPGERLTYQISWLGVPVGSAVFEVNSAGRFRGRPVWRFRMRAKTNEYADAIYKVRDDMQSWVDARMRRSVHFRKTQREGSYHRDVKLTFNHRKGRITYQNQWRKYPPRKLFKDSYDPLALVYGFRRSKVKKTGSMEMSATDGLKTIRASVRVHGKEQLTVGDVIYTCWKVEPELKDVGGIFKRSKNAKMVAWFTDDDHRLPVRLESEVLVGSFVATLIKVEGLK
jgi:hypothetical protein